MFCNGYTLLNGEKMAKSKGNFITLNDSIEKFGVDATRLTLADAGDGLDDANFETQQADGAILKFTTLEEWIKKNISLSIPDGKIDFKPHMENMDIWDKIFENFINQVIIEGTKYYDEMKYKQALKYCFFIL